MTDGVIEERLKVFLRPIDFVAGAQIPAQIPDFALPEIAFIGRSNVGKSSLLNALFNRKALARISSTPGRTRQLNFFNLNDQMIMVDVPGYGYAKASKSDVKSWQNTLFTYLRGRRQLARAMMLVDCRHGLKPIDKEMFALLNDAAVSFQVVLTKADLLPKSEHQQVIKATEKALEKEPAACPDVLLASGTKKLGIDAVRHAVLDAAMV